MKINPLIHNNMLIKGGHLIREECQLMFVKGMIKLDKIQLLMQYFIQAKNISGCKKYLQTIVGKEDRRKSETLASKSLIKYLYKITFRMERSGGHHQPSAPAQHHQ